MRNFKRVLVGAAAAAGSVAASAQTAPATDYSSILSGLDSSTAIAAVIGAGVILAGVGFAKWATRKVATFFG